MNFGACTEQLLLLSMMALATFVFPVLGYTDRFIVSSFIIALLFLMSPLEGLISALPPLSRANIALRQMQSLALSAPDRTDQEPQPIRAVTEIDIISLEGVTYTYHDDALRSFQLGPIDLSVRKGEVLFIVGGNGSGKTTLAKVLTGLYTPHAGVIRLNGIEVHEPMRDAYRQHFTAIFQDYHLFDVLLGVDRSQLESRVSEYISLLDLERKVRLDNDRFSTVRLSQGERKRLALIVALLEDRPVYLFDEWAADQDPSYRHLFYTQIVPELRNRGKTVIIVSHDDRYFSQGTRILALNAGRIADKSSQPKWHQDYESNAVNSFGASDSETCGIREGSSLP